MCPRAMKRVTRAHARVVYRRTIGQKGRRAALSTRFWSCNARARGAAFPGVTRDHNCNREQSHAREGFPFRLSCRLVPRGGARSHIDRAGNTAARQRTRANFNGFVMPNSYAFRHSSAHYEANGRGGIRTLGPFFYGQGKILLQNGAILRNAARMPNGRNT